MSNSFILELGGVNVAHRWHRPVSILRGRPVVSASSSSATADTRSPPPSLLPPFSSRANLSATNFSLQSRARPYSTSSVSSILPSARDSIIYSHLLSLVLSLSLSLSFPSYLFSAASHYKLHNLPRTSSPRRVTINYTISSLSVLPRTSSPRRVTINYTISSLSLSVLPRTSSPRRVTINYNWSLNPFLLFHRAKTTIPQLPRRAAIGSSTAGKSHTANRHTISHTPISRLSLHTASPQLHSHRFLSVTHPSTRRHHFHTAPQSGWARTRPLALYVYPTFLRSHVTLWTVWNYRNPQKCI